MHLLINPTPFRLVPSNMFGIELQEHGLSIVRMASSCTLIQNRVGLVDSPSVREGIKSEKFPCRASKKCSLRADPLRQKLKRRSTGRLEVVASAAVAERETEADFTWKGSDEFTELGDRYVLIPLSTS
jgi:hypothetical protein